MIKNISEENIISLERIEYYDIETISFEIISVDTSRQNFFFFNRTTYFCRGEMIAEIRTNSTNPIVL